MISRRDSDRQRRGRCGRSVGAGCRSDGGCVDARASHRDATIPRTAVTGTMASAEETRAVDEGATAARRVRGDVVAAAVGAGAPARRGRRARARLAARRLSAQCEDGSCVATLQNARGRAHRVHLCRNDGHPAGPRLHAAGGSRRDERGLRGAPDRGASGAGGRGAGACGGGQRGDACRTRSSRTSCRTPSACSASRRRRGRAADGKLRITGEGADMSDQQKGLPLLRKTPVDFLSREEARQALNPDVALDASEAARALRSEPNSENLLLAPTSVSRLARQPREPRLARQPRVARQSGPRQPRLARQPRVARQSTAPTAATVPRIVVRIAAGCQSAPRPERRRRDDVSSATAENFGGADPCVAGTTTSARARRTARRWPAWRRWRSSDCWSRRRRPRRSSSPAGRRTRPAAGGAAPRRSPAPRSSPAAATTRAAAPPAPSPISTSGSTRSTTVPFGDKMNSTGGVGAERRGTVRVVGERRDVHPLHGADTISAYGTVFTRVTLTFSGTGQVVDDATTQALTGANINGSVHALWRIGRPSAA